MKGVDLFRVIGPLKVPIYKGKTGRLGVLRSGKGKRSSAAKDFRQMMKLTNRGITTNDKFDLNEPEACFYSAH
jgi:hypothetical protein